jgi:hypothetical protein
LSSLLARLRRKKAEAAEFGALQRAMARLTPEEQRLFVEAWDKGGQPADAAGPTPAHFAAIERLRDLIAEEKAKGA